MVFYCPNNINTQVAEDHILELLGVFHHILGVVQIGIQGMIFSHAEILILKQWYSSCLKLDYCSAPLTRIYIVIYETIHAADP